MTASIMNKPKALTWTLIHALLFSLTGVSIKLTSGDITVYEQVFYRSAFALIVIIALFREAWVNLVKAEVLPLLISRGVFGFLGVTAMFYSMSELPLSVAMLITLTTPVFVMVLGHLITSENLTSKDLLPVGLILCGVILVMDVDFRKEVKMTLPMLPVLVGLFGSIMTAVAFISMRKALNVVSSKVVVFWFSACCFIGSGFMSLGSFTIPSESDLFYVLAICVFGLLSDFTKTTAYKYAVAWYVSLVSLVSVLFAAIWGWSIFGDRLVLIQLTGILLVILGIVYTVNRDRKRIPSG